jgi:ribosomal protein L40E
MAELLPNVLCSNCQSAGLELETETSAVCRYCGTVNPVAGILCPHCEAINPVGAETCEACHQTLVRRCANCNTPNWAGAEKCIRCQAPLDTVAALSARYRTDTAGRLRAQRHDAASIKAKEAVDSDRRMAEFNAMEERRLQYLDQSVKARNSQQRVWIAVLIVLGFIVVTAAVIGLVLVAAH